MKPIKENSIDIQPSPISYQSKPLDNISNFRFLSFQEGLSSFQEKSNDMEIDETILKSKGHPWDEEERQSITQRSLEEKHETYKFTLRKGEEEIPQEIENFDPKIDKIEVIEGDKEGNLIDHQKKVTIKQYGSEVSIRIVGKNSENYNPIFLKNTNVKDLGEKNFPNIGLNFEDVKTIERDNGNYDAVIFGLELCGSLVLLGIVYAASHKLAQLIKERRRASQDRPAENPAVIIEARNPALENQALENLAVIIEARNPALENQALQNQALQNQAFRIQPQDQVANLIINADAAPLNQSSKGLAFR